MATLLPLLLSALAFAGNGEQALAYELRIDGKPVGSRDVTVRFVRQEDGREVRLVESYTRIETTMLGKPVRFVNRASGRSGSGSGFTSSVDENGHIREVQALQRSDGSWRVTVIEGGRVNQGTLAAGQVSLTSLGLLDPVGYRDLTGNTRVQVLAAETGTLLSGNVEALGESTLQLGATPVRVNRWAWTSEAGRVELAWTEEGVLASWQSSFMGRPVEGLLREAPAARSYGSVEELAPVLGGVSEQEL
jgi:hypothetical protein